MTIRNENRWNAVARAVLASALAATMMLAGAGCSSGAAPSASGGQAGSAAAAESAEAASSQAGTDAAQVALKIDESLYDLEYTKRDKDPSFEAAEAVAIALAGATATSDSPDVTVDGSTVTIGAEGVYALTGELAGQVVVNAPEEAKVQLVLAGASIENANGSAIYVKQADKCFVTLADGSANELSDGQSYAFEGDADEPDATLFATCDLTLQGAGELKVTGAYNDAVKTKDDLVVTGGIYEVSAKGDGLVGKDSVKVADGTVKVATTEGDGVKSSKDDDESKGFVSLDGGSLTIDAGDKGVNAETYLRIADGVSLDVVAADDALHASRYARIAGGDIALSAGDDAVHAEYVLEVENGTIDVAKCVEGYEAQVITIGDATTHIVASDDGINASTGGASSSSDGQALGDPGAQGAMGTAAPDAEPSSSSAEGGQAMPGGMPPDQGQSGSSSSSDAQGATPPEPPAGFGSAGGDPTSASPASGSSASDSSAAPQGPGRMGMGGQMGGGMGGDPMADADENCVITINGGVTVVEAEGDGVDSNGYIYVNGGVTLVSGPTNSGNGSLDYGVGAEVSAGTFLAAGSSGMAESFTSGSQAFALVNASGNAGDEVAVVAPDGTALAWFKPTKDFQCVIATTEGMQDGTSYRLVVGGTSNAPSGAEYATAGQAGALSVEGGTSTEFTATTEGSAMGGMGAGFGGRGMGGQGGQMPDAADGQQGRGGMPRGQMPADGGGQEGPRDGWGGPSSASTQSSSIAA